LREAAPFECRAACGTQHAVTVAHLDHDGTNDAPDNLAWLYWSHHRMYDGSLYQREAIVLLQANWQRTRDWLIQGVPQRCGHERVGSQGRGDPQGPSDRGVSVCRASEERCCNGSCPP